MNLHPPQIHISIVIPVYNEQANINELYGQLCGVINSLDCHCEIIFVEDGSKDKTYEYLEAIRERDPRLKIIKFCINCGQSLALWAGFKEAKGDIIITMDGDMQNNPVDILLFLRKMEEGFDLVSGWRWRRDDPLNRKVISLLCNYFIWIKTGVRLHDYGCAFMAVKRTLLRKMESYGNEIKFFKVTLVLLADTIGEIKISHRARKSGASKYSFKRIIKLGAGFIFDFSIKQKKRFNKGIGDAD